MKKLIVLLTSLAALLLSSCSYKMVERDTRVLNPYQNPMMADLEVKAEKVNGTYSTNKKELGKCRWHTVDSKINLFKMNAVYDALQQVNGDVLVFSQFEVIKEDGARKVLTINVTGYPAVYKNFRHVDKENPIELKQNTPYLIEFKDNNGSTIGYKLVNNCTENCFKTENLVGGDNIPMVGKPHKKNIMKRHHRCPQK